MTKNMVRPRRNSQFFILFIVLLMLIGSPVAALRVYGSSVSEQLSPGATFIHEMTLSIPSDDSPTDVAIEVMGLGQLSDRSFYGLEPSKDRNPYSARSFISLDQQSVHLIPGEPVKVNATIRVPMNVGAGGRYAIIYIHTAPKGNATTGIATAVMVPVFITIAKSNIIQTGTITGIQVGEAVAGNPIVVTTGFTNTGNIALADIDDEITVRNATGGIIFTGIAKPSIFAIIPTFTIQFKATIDEKLPPGMYAVSSKVIVNKTKVLDEAKNTTFEVTKAYVPPFKDVSITLSPGSAATLASDDGKVAINFPAGAVLESIRVTLRATLLKDLPSAPKGTKLATTGFSVEGITGLLSKDATINVRYSPDDLEAASGDASKLMLARWEKAEGKWTLMPTTVDRNAGTLMVTTNRLSIWAVMVSEGAVPQGTKVDGFTVSIACGALALLFIMNRLQKR